MKTMFKFNKWIDKIEKYILEVWIFRLWLIVGVTAIILYFFRLFDLITVIKIVSALIIALLPIYVNATKKKQDVRIMAFTSQYLLEEDKSKVDDLLDLLITGKWKSYKLDPVKTFFGSLEDLSKNGDVEIRRRIAEALPALFILDVESSKKLFYILRQDYDESFWKSDIRRRAIQSLSNIIEIDKEFVLNNLYIRSKDEIYTVIAIIEVLAIIRKDKPKKANNIYNIIRKGIEDYSFEEQEAIESLWKFIEMVDKDKRKTILELERLKETDNITFAICLARNFRKLCNYPRCMEENFCSSDFSDKILNYMVFFLNPSNDDNVRRPICRCLDCLLLIFSQKSHPCYEQAKRLIWGIFTDKDIVIRLSALDKLDNLYDINSIYCHQLLSYLIQNESDPDLLSRNKRLYYRLYDYSIEFPIHQSNTYNVNF
jgi:hypothetical protein